MNRDSGYWYDSSPCAFPQTSDRAYRRFPDHSGHHLWHPDVLEHRINMAAGFIPSEEPNWVQKVVAPMSIYGQG